MHEIAVLIPCYNEAQTIAKVVRDFLQELPGAVVYVYDNNSSDDTILKAKQAGAEIGRCFTQGKGAVIRQMFREIDARCYIVVDGDDTYSAKDAPEMISHIFHGHADMVVGDRLSTTYFTENKRRFHGIGNRLTRKLIDLLFHGKIDDILTGYRAFSYRFVKSFPVLSDGFEIETEMTIHAIIHRMNIVNVPVEYKDRPDGSVSKLHTIRDGKKVLHAIWKFCQNYRPFLFFGTISAVIFLLATILFLPVLFTYLQTGDVPRFPTLITCGFALVIAVQSLLTGILSENLLKKELREFEFRLLDVEKHYISETKILCR